MTYLESGMESMMATDGSSTGKVNSQAEADCCRTYNDKVYKYKEMHEEVELIDLYMRNLDDKKSYKLTASQMQAIGF